MAPTGAQMAGNRDARSAMAEKGAFAVHNERDPADHVDGPARRQGRGRDSSVAGNARHQVKQVKRNHRRAAPCVLATFGLVAGCQTVTEYVVPHPKHAEQSVHEAITEVFDGLERTERDLKRIFSKDGFEEKGRLFVQVEGSGIDAEFAVLLHQGMSHILEDAGYEIVAFEELEEAIERDVSGERLSCDQRVPHAAARALQAHDGVGALDICVTSVSSLGLGELNNEGKYEHRLRMSVTTKLHEAKWGDELFRDRATLTSRSVVKQAERYYAEKVRGMSTSEQAMYPLLLEHVHALLPRLAESSGEQP